MKKLFLLTILTGMCSPLIAQETNVGQIPSKKYSVETNSFGSNWFIQTDISSNSFYFDEDQGSGLSNNPFKGFRHQFGISLALGKWFTPGLGLRTKLNGILGKIPTLNENIKYWNLQEQVLFNLSNMLCGYNESRVWNFIPYAGAGVLRYCSGNNYAMGLSYGILNTWKLNRNILINLDINATSAEKDFDGIKGNHSSASLKHFDNIISAEVGLTFNLGKAKWNKVPDVEALETLHQSEIDALNAKLSDAQSENKQLKEKLNNRTIPTPEPKHIKEFVSNPVSIFFDFNKSNIASRKELQNVKEVVDFAKSNNSKVIVTGYADSKTGSASYNKELSQKRANTVADEIVKMGLSRDNIEIIAAGGVKDLSPISYNRRVTVIIK